MKTIGMITVAILSAIWKAYVLTILWGWFIVPFGIAALGVAHAYGLMCVATIIWFSLADMKAAQERSSYELVMINVIAPTVLLVIGWITHAFMI